MPQPHYLPRYGILNINYSELIDKFTGSNDNSLQVVELSGLQTCKLLSTHPSKPFLLHYSSKPQRPSGSLRSWQRILLSGDVHPNPGPTTKYPCLVCARNVTSRGVSYLCNRCSGWVQNAAEYRQTKDWVCSSCNSPPLDRNYNHH